MCITPAGIIGAICRYGLETLWLSFPPSTGHRRHVSGTGAQHGAPGHDQEDPILAWIVDGIGLPKKATHSIGVARQYCEQTGKQNNCQVAVSLSAAIRKASLPIAYRLYLSEAWAHDAQSRKQARILQEVRFQTKLEIALSHIRQAIADGVAQGAILADPAYGNDTGFSRSAGRHGTGLCRRGTEFDDRLGAGNPAAASSGLEGRSLAACTPCTPRTGSCPGFGKTTGALVAGQNIESGYLAGRNTAPLAFPHRSCVHPPRASQSKADRAACRRMAVDRMASRGSRAAQILAIQPDGKHLSLRSGRAGQAALDHRTRLPRTEAETWATATSKAMASAASTIKPRFRLPPTGSW